MYVQSSLSVIKIKLSNICTNQSRSHNFIFGFILSDVIYCCFFLEQHSCTYPEFPTQKGGSTGTLHCQIKTLRRSSNLSYMSNLLIGMNKVCCSVYLCINPIHAKQWILFTIVIQMLGPDFLCTMKQMYHTFVQNF